MMQIAVNATEVRPEREYKGGLVISEEETPRAELSFHVEVSSINPVKTEHFILYRKNGTVILDSAVGDIPQETAELLAPLASAIGESLRTFGRMLKAPETREGWSYEGTPLKGQPEASWLPRLLTLIN